MAGAPAAEGIKRDALRARLEAIAKSPERSSVLAALQAQGRPIYEAAPEHPGFVVRIEHSGKRVLGRFEGRQFVAQQPATTSRRRKIAGA